jgi:hypothetical protein
MKNRTTDRQIRGSVFIFVSHRNRMMGFIFSFIDLARRSTG